MTDMTTPEQLAEMLRDVNVAQVARAANVSTKTIYRLRHFDPAGKTAPNLRTVQRLLDAIKATKKPARKPASEAA